MASPKGKLVSLSLLLGENVSLASAEGKLVSSASLKGKLLSSSLLEEEKVSLASPEGEQ